MTQIIPAILAQTQEEFNDKARKVESSWSLLDGWVQIDFMDNKFVQNKSVTPFEINQFLNRENIEAHLMVDDPISWIEELKKYSGIKRIIIPVERVTELPKGDYEIGLSLNPETELESLAPFVSTIECVLVMSVNPGFSGQEFITDSIEKVRKIKERWPELVVEVDGGIDQNSAKELSEAGAERLIIGSALLDGDIDENIKTIKESLNR